MMPINDGQSHTLPNGTTILFNPDNSNKPNQHTANKPNESTDKAANNGDEQGNNQGIKNTEKNEEANNINIQMQQQMQMLQQLINDQKEAKESQQDQQQQGQKEAKQTRETLERMRQDIQNIKQSNNEIKQTNNEIRESISLTTAKADEALLRSTEATEQAAENKLRLNKIEADITTIKAMQTEATTENDEALEEMATIKKDVTQAKKDINTFNNKIDGLHNGLNNKIDGLQTTIETINREMAAKLVTNISMDNPDIAEQQNMTRNIILPFQRQQMIREEEQHQRAKYIMDIARKRVGLKPITVNHICDKAGKQIQITEINNQQNAYYRKMAAHDFLEQELKIFNTVITSSKQSTTSDILWIQLDNEKTAIDIQKQSASIRGEARAIMYPPPEFYQTIKSVEHNCNEQKKINKELRYIVKIGTDNIELWTKHPQEPQYSKQPLDTYGEIEPPNLDRIRITPNFGQSPPKGRGKPHEYNISQLQTPQQTEQLQGDRTEQTQNTPQQQAPPETEKQQAGQKEPTQSELQQATPQIENQQVDQMGPNQNIFQRAANTPPNHNTHQTIIRANEADQINNKHQNTGQIQTRKTRNDQINNKQQTITGQTQTTKTHGRNINTQAQDNNEQVTNKNQQEQQDKTAQSTTTYQDIIANLQNDINKSRNILEENTNHTNPDQNPSKQQQITLKRTIENNEADEAIPKRINIQTPTEEEMMIEDILKSPGWPDDSTETSQTAT